MSWFLIVLLITHADTRRLGLSVTRLENFRNDTAPESEFRTDFALINNARCELGPNEGKDIGAWFGIVKKKPALEAECKNLGAAFGWWGATACPTKLSDVVSAVDLGASQAEGGKTSTEHVITERYVIKVIEHEEHEQLLRLLFYLLDEAPVSQSLLVPTCRILRVKRDQYLQISPNIAVRGYPGRGFNQFYDLKGNWDYSARNAESNEVVKKDQNFHARFPHGLTLKMSIIKDQMLDDNPSLFDKKESCGKQIIDLLTRDTMILEKLGLMDYSLLVNIVEVPATRLSVRHMNWKPEELDEVYRVNRDKPLFLVVARGQQYLMSIGIIDVLMNTNKTRGFWNKFASGITASDCTPADIDPIPSEAYRVRFMRMVGVKLPFEGKPCAPCLLNAVLPDSDAIKRGYTYLRSRYQYDMKELFGNCSWG